MLQLAACRGGRLPSRVKKGSEALAQNLKSIQKLCPTRLKILISRGAHFLPARKFDPTRLKILNFRGVHLSNVQIFDPTRLKVLNSRGADKANVQIFDPTRLKVLNSRGADKTNVQIFDPTKLPFFNSRGASPQKVLRLMRNPLMSHHCISSTLLHRTAHLVCPPRLQVNSVMSQSNKEVSLLPVFSIISSTSVGSTVSRFVTM